MPRVLVVLALVVVGLVAMVLSIAVLSRLTPHFGFSLAAVVTFYAAFGAAWEGRHTPESRVVAEVFIETLARLRITRIDAADRMGISESQLHRQLAGYDMLASPYRLAQMGTEFRELFYALSAEREQRGQYLANSFVLEILHTVRMLTGQHVVTSVSDQRCA